MKWCGLQSVQRLIRGINGEEDKGATEISLAAQVGRGAGFRVRRIGPCREMAYKTQVAFPKESLYWTDRHRRTSPKVTAASGSYFPATW
ncbi:unnamed protein product [Pylaiella littoralis]